MEGPMRMKAQSRNLFLGFPSCRASSGGWVPHWEAPHRLALSFQMLATTLMRPCGLRAGHSSTYCTALVAPPQHTCIKSPL